MIENRLSLNKKPKYELPDEVLIDKYERRKKNGRIPDFVPDICLTSFGSIRVKPPRNTVVQIWVKTDNKELLKFIRSFDFESKLFKITNSYNMEVWKFKKIILEEFYGVKNGK